MKRDDVSGVSEISIDVWSDYVCPFCRLAQPALTSLTGELGDRVRLNFRAFELRPEPLPALDDDRERYRGLFARWIEPRARQLGLAMHFPPKHPRTRLAHMLAAFSRDTPYAADLHALLFRALWEDGKDIGDREVLAALADEAGLDEGAARKAFASSRLREAVEADERLAAALGISGVPTFLIRPAGAPIESSRVLVGVQTPEELCLALPL